MPEKATVLNRSKKSADEPLLAEPVVGVNVAACGHGEKQHTDDGPNR
ncbi:hypothetical protein [Ectothiorhodospira shaposhnikovii]|nr:hypothetical protein [Ectothiorhodospira shaposhnikovii]MCG5513137.1 hypothetical protein [Ectothiorhodospira shaposhnikovii]